MKRRTKRQAERAQKAKARKRAGMKSPGGESVYARKKLHRDYPPNSPYRTIWKEYA